MLAVTVTKWIETKFTLLTMDIKITDYIEIVLLAMLIYYVLVWIQKTKAWSLLKGVGMILVFYLIVVFCEFDTIEMLLKQFSSAGLVAVMILFQPEMRRVLEIVGDNNFLKKWFPLDASKEQGMRFSDETIDAIVNATFELGQNKTGALMVVEQNIALDEFVKTGIDLDAQVSMPLLIQIFEHNTPLHDGAVIIRGNRILAATCYLPLSHNDQISKALGTRHRAGIGISEITDSITIIASEETGKVSIAVGGQLISDIDSASLRSKLMFIQKKSIDVKRFRLWKKGKLKRNEEEADKQSDS